MHWYLVFTKPRQEQVALENLERQGYRCYLPKWQVEKKKRGRRTVEWASANEPLFPRYLFIELDTGPSGLSWGPIRSTTGVTSLVRFGLQPARAPTGLIDILRALEAQHAQSAARPLEPGDLVSLREGPFAGLQAVYQCQDSNARITVLLEVMSRPVRVQVEAGAVFRQVTARPPRLEPMAL
jgi:transcriptional antiterminator RfaH